MNRNPSLTSVIIPTYNRPNWLGQAIESALSQSYPAVEVIVVDDGSTTEETRTIVSHYSQVHYIFQTNRGLGAARNAGLAASGGEFIQFLDDDDWLVPDALSVKSGMIGIDPSVGVVYSDLYLTDANGINQGCYFADRTRPMPIGDIYLTLLQRNFIPIHAMLWRRSVLEHIGGFPHRSGSEDWECVLRASEYTRFDYVDEPLGYYRLHDKNMTLRLGHQTQGDGAVQQYITASQRFTQVPASLRARLLSSYGLQQWLEGDPDLGYRFYRMGRKCNPFHPFPWLLRGVMLIGRPLGRLLMHSLWKVHLRLNRFPSAADYFLVRADK